MRIQHNIMAMNAYRNYTNNVSAMKKNLEKLSSGYKINRAGDDAAGLAISEKMRAQITGLETAQKNAKDGISLVQTAEGALTEVHDMLNRMVTLATQSANGTYDNETDRYQIQKELDQLREEINRIADSSNFNGIKLLNGDLEATGETKIEVGGNVTHKTSGGVKGAYATDTALADGSASAEGGTAEYSVALSDGTSVTVSFTFAKDANNKITRMIGANGAEYTVTDSTPKKEEIANAIASELNKTALGEKYTVSQDGTTGKLKFEAKEEGTDTPAIKSVDYHADYSKTGNPYTVHTATNVEQTTQALDAGREIDADSITEYDGTNYDEAVFTINGHKFVLLSEKLSTSTTATVTGTDPDNYVKATQGLGPDVTILIGGRGGLKAGGATAAPGASNANTANDNFEQNIKKIEEVTGLSVGNTITEATNSNGINVNGGIRLTKGTVGGGLVLQIGDTADSYNQLRVSIKDMHTDAMGIDKISVADQNSAQSAIDVIKKAINYVSDVRGTLGATQNRLDHTINNLSVMQENIQDAESTIRDTDVAAEMMAYTKNNILIQSAQAMLAQANQVPQGVLQLLQ